MSFSGFKSHAKEILENDKVSPKTFGDLVNMCSSFQKSLFEQTIKSLHRTVEFLCVRKGLPITAINLCGGVACNKMLRAET
jgi:tRNA A37 threonylcarbamoyltransferase TsaD